MRTALCMAVCVLGLLIPAGALAETHTFHETNGRTHVGTFLKVQGDKVSVRVRNRTSSLSFWALTKEDQQYVLSQVKADPLVASTLKAAEDPRQWTDSRSNKTAARFLEVKTGGTVVLIIDAKKAEFAYENFSKVDQDYVRDQVRGTPSESFLPAEVKQDPAAPQLPMPGNVPGVIPQIPTTTPQFPPTATTPPVGGTTNGQAMHAAASPATTPMPNYSPPTQQHAAAASPMTPPVNSAPPNQQMHAAATSTLPTASNTQPPPPTTMPPAMTPPPVAGGNDMVAVYTCSNCNKEVSAGATSCPHCKTRFDYVENENGTRTYTSGGNVRRWGSLFKLGIWVVIGIGGVIGKLAMKK